MVGSTEIRLHGKRATVGWITQNPEAPTAPVPAIKIENTGGEDVIVVEGGVRARIMRDSLRIPLTQYVEARGERPGFLQFDGNDTVILMAPRGPGGKCWYVCFYPEVDRPD